MILVTAFKPFGTLKENSSFEALSKANLQDNVKKYYLDVDLVKTKEELEYLIDNVKPEMIIMFGESGMFPKVQIERRAHNLLNFRIEDNGGHMPINQKIEEKGKEYLTSSLNIDYLIAYLKAAGIEAEASLDAGQFICNYSYYLALKTKIPCVFVHLPLFIGQSSDPKYYYRDYLYIVRAVELTVKGLTIKK